MAASGNAIAADEAAFNFVVNRDTTPTVHGKIEGVPFLKVQPIGGGEMKLRARTSNDGNRASRHPLADGLEVRWVALVSDRTIATPPTTTAQCPNVFISPRALLIIALEPENKNKMFYCFIRWVNLGKPANNGPWSDLFQSGIL